MFGMYSSHRLIYPPKTKDYTVHTSSVILWYLWNGNTCRVSWSFSISTQTHRERMEHLHSLYKNPVCSCGLFLQRPRTWMQLTGGRFLLLHQWMWGCSASQVSQSKPRRDNEKSKTKFMSTSHHFNTSTSNGGDKREHSLRGWAHAHKGLETAEKLRMCWNQTPCPFLCHPELATLSFQAQFSQLWNGDNNSDLSPCEK